MRAPLLPWSTIIALAVIPSLAGIAMALLVLPPSLRTGTFMAAILIAPVNLVAVAIPALAGRREIHLALIGVIVALVIRALGAGLTVIAVQVTGGNDLLPALTTCAALLLTTLGAEAYLYACRLTPMPSTVPTESARV